MDCLFYSCDNLTDINISNWDLNNITDFAEVFYKTPYLRSISMHNSDHNSVNKIIEQLPTRATDSMGTLNVAGVDDISQVNTADANTKYWNIINEENIYFVLGKSKLGQGKLK
jgi:surface protein